MDILNNKLRDLLETAKNESAEALREVKDLVFRMFYELSSRGFFPASLPDVNISEGLKQQVQSFLTYLKNNEDEILEDQENATHIAQEVSASVVAGGKRRRKTRKHSKRRKHTRKHYRPKGKKL